MSLLINGMDMPISCTECPCYDDMETCFCNVLDSYCEQYKTERHPNCPLVEVHTPHGDLIDRNELLNQYKPDPIEEQLMKLENPIAYQMMDKIVDKVTESINSVKAIIEAEG